MRTLCLLVLCLCLSMAVLPQSRKASPSLAKNKTGQWMLAVDNIDLFKKDFPRIAILRQYDYANIIVIDVGGIPQAEQLLASPRVIFADHANRQAKEELIVSGFDAGLNRINAVHNFYPTITGEGLMVSIKENMFDSNDIDFKGRVFSSGFASSTISGHASIMATMIGGAGNTFYEGKGAAWKTNMQSATFANLLPEPETYYRNQRINVQNHSYGTGVENYYGVDAAAYDALVRNNPTLLHVFSSGNSGTATGTGVYSGIAAFANLTGSFKMAKNIITVGATDSIGNIEIPSSRGPAYDGRIKPELVAFGQDGSSGSAAIVSGIALLVQHAFQQQHHDSLPAAALVKSVLMNTADDAGNKGPDYAAGFGIANALKAVNSIRQSHFIADSISHSAIKTFSLDIPAGIRSLKLTMAWTDVAATANATKAMVNDVDLELIHVASGQIWKPWVLSSFPHKDSLLLPAVRKRDSLNNVEQITVDDPVAGTYTIRVTGYNISQGNQPFFIAYEADTANRFQWTYPMSSDPMQSGWSNMLRWQSTFPANTTAQLAYSTDNGNNWQNISNNVDVSKPYLRWNSPAVFSKAILRMTIGANNFYSDTFAISNPVKVAVGFNCSDSFLFYWNRPAGVNSFRIYQLGNKFLEPLTVTTDTFYTSSTNAVKHFTVVPIINGKEGIKAITFNYTTQGVGCYFKSFLTQLMNDKGQLSLELGTLHGIKNILVQKLSSAGFSTIQTVSNLSGLQYLFTDALLQQGVNTYRIVLVMNDGRMIYSTNEVIYYLTTSAYVIYPNPSRGLFRILQKEVGNVRVVVHDAFGRKITDEQHDELVIPVRILNKGFYVVSIWKDGKREYLSRILVQ